MSFDDWDIIIQTFKKSKFYLNDDFVFPGQIFEQSEIFNHQKEKFIKPYNKVAVLASFPLFLLDYYGVKNLSIGLDCYIYSYNERIIYKDRNMIFSCK